MRPTDRLHPLREVSLPQPRAGMRAFVAVGPHGQPAGGLLLQCPPCHGNCSQGHACPARQGADRQAAPQAPARAARRRQAQFRHLLALVAGLPLALVLLCHLAGAVVAAWAQRG